MKKTTNKKVKKTNKITQTKVEKPQDTPLYSVNIKIFGKNYKAEGHTVNEALTNLKPLGKVAGTSVLSVIKGTTQKDRVIPAVQLNRIFSPSRLMKEIAIKNLSLFFKDL